MHDIIRIIRDILLRTFLISLLIGLLFVGVYFGGRGYWQRLTVDRFALIDEKSFNVVVMDFLLLIRFYLVFVLLTPALALHWTLRRLAR